MTILIGIAGSLRSHSLNLALLNAAAGTTLDDASLEIASLRGIPLYDGDLEEAEGIPPAVRQLQTRIEAAEGLILASPEYNNSVPGVLKNAIDWLSRPPERASRVFHDLPVALMGATPGTFGTGLSQVAWLPVLRALRTRHWTGGRLLVSRASDSFNAEGEVVDEKLRKRIREFMAGFIGFVRDQK